MYQHGKIAIDDLEGLFWTTIQSVVARIYRGELFSAIERLDALRIYSLVPLIQQESKQQRGIIDCSYKRYPLIIDTLPLGHDAKECLRATGAMVELYRELRSTLYPLYQPPSDLEYAIKNFLERGPSTSSNLCLSVDARSRELHSHFSVFLKALIARLPTQADVIGAALSGSWLSSIESNSDTGPLDAYSDLDLHLVVAENRVLCKAWQLDLAATLAKAHIINRRGAAHLMCLYDTPLLRVDMRFSTLKGIASGYEVPYVLWERDRDLSDALRYFRKDLSLRRWPQPSFNWIDSRFWLEMVRCINVHFRRDILSLVWALSLVRSKYIGPLVALSHNRQCRGLRRLEQRFPALCFTITKTLPGPSIVTCRDALAGTVSAYLELRSLMFHNNELTVSDAEQAVRKVLFSRTTRT